MGKVARALARTNRRDGGRGVWESFKYDMVMRQLDSVDILFFVLLLFPVGVFSAM